IRLLGAAGYAPNPHADPAAVPDVQLLLRRATAGLRVAPGGQAHLPTLRVPSETLLESLPDVVEGADAVVQTAFLLLRAAATRHPETDAPVCLSLSDATHALLAAPELRDAWHATLRGLLGGGWRFHHLWQIPSGGSWSPRVIAELSALLTWPEKYEPSYVHCQETPWSPRDVLIVPGFAALIGLAAGPGAADAALVVREPERIQALSEHFARLVHHAKPLITTYLVGDGGDQGNAARLRFTEVLTDAHEEPGEHCMVKSGIPLRFVPSSPWWSQILRDLGNGHRGGQREIAYRQRLWEYRLRTRHALAAKMRTWRHREIGSTSGIRRFVADGVVSSDDFLLDGLPPLPREERADALLQFLGQLRRHPNYELALVDRDLDPLTSVVWVVKGSRFFCLEVVNRGTEDQRLDFMVVITEEQLVAGFRAYFEHLWNSLPARCRDKPRIEQWLDRQLEALQ
ncbi:MAG: hypothetical protein ACRDJC_16630, partial [Thermomicrobiales bacterium]